MNVKPTYEELERRVRELESLLSYFRHPFMTELDEFILQ